ncbi:MAG: MerR family transcriptional regulator [Rothia sp. (in: high G+C Gram-positive bacteria)]|nr:MerR family transcriptional regulator [Rothia sp. (in: high G+C Gram-positive bacteria)]
METFDKETLSVGQVSELMGVSVRTLHHFEDKGLINPARTTKGYRMYSALDIDRLHQILVYRSLDFPLDSIGRIIDDGAPTQHLERQKTLLTAKIRDLQSILHAVESLMEVNMNTPTPAEKARAAHAQYAEETEQHFGHSDAYRQSAARTARFTDDDWRQATAESEALEATCAQALREGVVPGSGVANKLAEQHRTSINRYFDCSYSQQVLIAKSYVADPRFSAHYNEREPGLAQWIHDAILANATIHGVNVENPEWV